MPLPTSPRTPLKETPKSSSILVSYTSCHLWQPPSSAPTQLHRQNKRSLWEAEMKGPRSRAASLCVRHTNEDPSHLTPCCSTFKTTAKNNIKTHTQPNQKSCQGSHCRLVLMVQDILFFFFAWMFPVLASRRDIKHIGNKPTLAWLSSSASFMHLRRVERRPEESPGGTLRERALFIHDSGQLRGRAKQCRLAANEGERGEVVGARLLRPSSSELQASAGRRTPLSWRSCTWFYNKIGSAKIQNSR